MTAAELNQWIIDHQAIVATVGLPLLTLIITQMTSSGASRRNLENNRRDRELQLRLQVANYRREWIEQLRSELTEFVTLLATKGLGDSEFSKVPYFMSNFQMKLNRDEPLADDLVQKIIAATAQYLEDDKAESGKVHHDLCEASLKFLKSEWSRLKDELGAIEGTKL